MVPEAPCFYIPDRNPTGTVTGQPTKRLFQVFGVGECLGACFRYGFCDSEVIKSDLKVWSSWMWVQVIEVWRVPSSQLMFCDKNQITYLCACLKMPWSALRLLRFYGNVTLIEETNIKIIYRNLGQSIILRMECLNRWWLVQDSKISFLLLHVVLCKAIRNCLTSI